MLGDELFACLFFLGGRYLGKIIIAIIKKYMGRNCQYGLRMQY